MSVDSSDGSRDESPLDPTAERVADFVTGQIGVPASSRSSANEFERRLAAFQRGRQVRKRFTAGAAVTLLEKVGANILEASFLIELSFLNGRQKLQNHPVRSLVVY